MPTTHIIPLKCCICLLTRFNSAALYDYNMCSESFCVELEVIEPTKNEIRKALEANKYKILPRRV